MYWVIVENIAPAVRAKQRINSFSIAHLGKPILEEFFLQIESSPAGDLQEAPPPGKGLRQNSTT